MGFLSSIFGGGSSSSAAANNNVDVTVNPQIDIENQIDVDLSPVATLVDHYAAQSQELAEAFKEQGATEAAVDLAIWGDLKDGVSKAAMAAGVAFIVWKATKK